MRREKVTKAERRKTEIQPRQKYTEEGGNKNTQNVRKGSRWIGEFLVRSAMPFPESSLHLAHIC
jgi:hypothetical protein